ELLAPTSDSISILQGNRNSFSQDQEETEQSAEADGPKNKPEWEPQRVPLEGKNQRWINCPKDFWFPDPVLLLPCKETEIHFSRIKKKEWDWLTQRAPRTSWRENYNSSHWKGISREEMPK
ncbi:UNVERIFIED_CONTAM: hypothetical protein K2H54_063483, partial [Gekko kuhli]